MYGEEIHDYKGEIVKYIESTEKKDSLFAAPILPPGPECFTITSDGQIYVCDTLRHRIVVYDMNFNYLKEIKSENRPSYIGDAIDIKVNEKREIFLNIYRSQIVKINPDGSFNYSITDENFRKHVFKDGNYFLIKDYLFFYDFNGSFVIVTNDGTFLDINNYNETLKKINGWEEGILADNKKIMNYIDSNNIIFYKNRFYHNNFNVYLGYLELLKQEVKKNKQFKYNIRNFKTYSFLGFDNDDNMYWGAITKDKNQKAVIFVFSKQGEILDCFFNHINPFTIQIAPNGDIYFMNIDDNGVCFFKISRKWQ